MRTDKSSDEAELMTIEEADAIANAADELIEPDQVEENVIQI